MGNILLKDLGDATYILCIIIYINRQEWLLGLSQSTYLDKILKRFNMKNSKKGDLPMHHTCKLSKSQCPSSYKEIDTISRIPYALAIISIMYVMTCIRPDVAYALSMVSRSKSWFSSLDVNEEYS